MVTAPAVQLTIFRIKKGILDPDAIILDRDSLQDFPVRTANGLLGVLYVKTSETRRPRWLQFFKGALDVREVPVRSASSAAILHVPRGKRVYVLAFGYGRSLIAPEAVDERFGLRVTLNAIDPNRIRSIDRKTFEAISRHTREQMSRASPIGEFGLDVERDLLRAVTGTPADESLGRRLTGMDALTATVNESLDGLGNLLDRYGALSERADYRANFPWVDNLAQVTNPDAAAALDESVVQKIKRRETETIWLAPPGLVDWSQVGGFRYRSAKTATVFEDLLLEEYLADARSRDELTTDAIRRDRVHCLNGTQDVVVEIWSIKSCLCAEVQRQGATYVLTEGQWYRIDKDFAQDIDRSVNELAQTGIPLLPFDHQNEGEYNRLVADASGARLALMHERLVDAGGGRGRIEFCDLYALERVIVHVKRYGASSQLSHLFGQGVVSGRLFAFDASFRHKVNEALPPTHRLAEPQQQLRTADYEVAFAVLAKNGRECRLPFFSRVNLRTAVETLRGWGYQVTLTVVGHGEPRRQPRRRRRKTQQP